MLSENLISRNTLRLIHLTLCAVLFHEHIDNQKQMTTHTTDKNKYEKVNPKYWVTMILTYLIMPLVLFLSAMDIYWWQGWGVSVLLLVIGIGSRFLAEKSHPGLMSERFKFGKDQNVKPWDKVLAPLMGFSLTFPLFIVAGLDHQFEWSPIFPLWLNIIGLMLVALGYSFASWAIIENQFFSVMMRIQLDRGHKVCESGPYRIVRHPGYAGNILPLIGIIFALDSLWTIIPSLLALIVIFIRTILEDKALLEELSGYREYASRVRYRLIPGIF